MPANCSGSVILGKECQWCVACCGIPWASELFSSSVNITYSAETVWLAVWSVYITVNGPLNQSFYSNYGTHVKGDIFKSSHHKAVNALVLTVMLAIYKATLWVRVTSLMMKLEWNNVLIPKQHSAFVNSANCLVFGTWQLFS